MGIPSLMCFGSFVQLLIAAMPGTVPGSSYTPSTLGNPSIVPSASDTSAQRDGTVPAGCPGMLAPLTARMGLFAELLGGPPPRKKTRPSKGGVSPPWGVCKVSNGPMLLNMCLSKSLPFPMTCMTLILAPLRPLFPMPLKPTSCLNMNHDAVRVLCLPLWAALLVAPLLSELPCLQAPALASLKWCAGTLAKSSSSLTRLCACSICALLGELVPGGMHKPLQAYFRTLPLIRVPPFAAVVSQRYPM
jgi:hypothetical protein